VQEQIVQDIDFGKLGGIVPVVVQDAKSRQVLMVAFMNEEAFSRTVGSGFMWYFSRKRKTLWKKGEQSGHVQIVKAIYLDCDNDTILAEVEQVGGACDLGYRSCFDKKWHDDSFVVDGGAAQVFDPSAAYAAYAEDIRLAVPTGSLERCTRELLGFALENGTSTDGEFFRGALPAHSGTAVFFGHNPRDIPALIASGEYDAGITGFDIALEAGTSVVPIANLGYNKRGQGAALWAVAVPDSSPATRIHDLEGATVVSDLTAVTAEFFRRHGLSITVRPRPDGDHAEFFVGDPVVELIETGATLQRFSYRPLARVLVTHAVIIAHPASYGYTWKRRRIEAIATAFQESVSRLPVADCQLFPFPDEPPPDDAAVMAWEAHRRAWFTRYGGGES